MAGSPAEPGREALNGVFCAAATPLNADLSVDHALLALHAENLLVDGCDGIALLGTTGEATSFTTRERMEILEKVVAAGIEPARLAPGTGAASVFDTIELTRHALSCGVNRVLMLPPFYYRNVAEDALVSSYSFIVDRVNDPALQAVLYHIPQMSGVAITPAVVRRLLDRFGGVIAGIKDSSADLANATALIEQLPGFPVLVGADPLMLPTLAIGGAGCITATSNFVARDLAEIYRHNCDRAQAERVDALQRRITEARRLTSGHAQISSVKSALAHLHGQAGWLRVRPPQMSLDQARAGEVGRAVGALLSSPLAASCVA